MCAIRHRYGTLSSTALHILVYVASLWHAVLNCPPHTALRRIGAGFSVFHAMQVRMAIQALVALTSHMPETLHSAVRPAAYTSPRHKSAKRHCRAYYCSRQMQVLLNTPAATTVFLQTIKTVLPARTAAKLVSIRGATAAEVEGADTPCSPCCGPCHPLLFLQPEPPPLRATAQPLSCRVAGVLRQLPGLARHPLWLHGLSTCRHCRRAPALLFCRGCCHRARRRIGLRTRRRGMWTALLARLMTLLWLALM